MKSIQIIEAINFIELHNLSIQNIINADEKIIEAIIKEIEYNRCGMGIRFDCGVCPFLCVESNTHSRRCLRKYFKRSVVEACSTNFHDTSDMSDDEIINIHLHSEREVNDASLMMKNKFRDVYEKIFKVIRENEINTTN